MRIPVTTRHSVGSSGFPGCERCSPGTASSSSSASPMLREQELLSDELPLATRLRYQTRLSLRRCRELVGDNPVFLPLVLACTPEGRSRAITAGKTDVVVEGFPRCGNTFAAA